MQTGGVFMVRSSQLRSRATEITWFIGDIIYMYTFGNPIIIINSAQAATDLLEKRSSNYSSRPVRTMVQELSDGLELYVI